MEGINDELLEYVVFPMLGLGDGGGGGGGGLRSVRLTCSKWERLSRKALVANLVACGKWQCLLSFGECFADERRKDLQGAALFFRGAVRATRAEDREEEEEYPVFDGQHSLIRTKYSQFHLLWGANKVFVAEHFPTRAFYHAFSHYRLAYVLGQLHQPEAALAGLERTLADIEMEEGGGAMHRDFLTALYALASGLCLDIAEKTGSVELLARVLHLTEKYSGSSLAFYNEACAHCLAGNHKDALASLEKAIQLDACLPSKKHALNDSQLAPLHPFIVARYPDDGPDGGVQKQPKRPLGEAMYAGQQLRAPSSFSPMQVIAV